MATASAAPIDEAKKLFNEGNYQAALEILKPLAAKSPRDGNINYWYGATLNALDRPDEAVSALEKAEARGVADASLLLAKIATAQYRPDDARDYYDTYRTQMRKNKKSVPESVEQEISRLVLMENMLSRVEKIAVIDSLVVDADGFSNITVSRLRPDVSLPATWPVFPMPKWHSFRRTTRKSFMLCPTRPVISY